MYGGSMNKLLMMFFLLVLAVPVHAKEPIRTIECMVVSVVDGDTVHAIDRKNTKMKIRLYGIDAPETEKRNHKTGVVSKPGQPYGEEASQALHKKVDRSVVNIKIMDIDRYKRLVGIIYNGNRNINQEMVAEGYAWAYRRYLSTPYKSEFIDAEESARKGRLGLWQQSNPEPPWEFRKRTKIRD